MTQNTALSRIAMSLAVALALVHNASFAQDKKAAPSAAPAPAKKDDKVDISDLENKYWAPKDTDFSVVQNRTYTKEGRYFLTGHFGSPVNDQWGTGNVAGASFNYFWSERFGVQATYLKGSLRDNKAADAIATNYGSGIRVDHSLFDSYMGLGFNIVPFYAKMSLWGKKIMYFDMAITPTIGLTNYKQRIQDGDKMQSGAFTYGVDVTQYFFFTNYFAVRADLKNQWHKEDVARYYQSNGIKTGEKVSDQIAQDTLFLLGVTFFY